MQLGREKSGNAITGNEGLDIFVDGIVLLQQALQFSVGYWFAEIEPLHTAGRTQELNLLNSLGALRSNPQAQAVSVIDDGPSHMGEV
jgi:hypothetical protein